MAEPTQHTTTDDTPASTEASPASYGYCSWHKRFAEGVRLIDVQEQGSGPGGAIYACGPCRTTHDLTPFADRP
ncbi:hypothetical protein ACF1AE_25720 [Streptomyces sp. NPDC014986]|uniref:hypothetical protein n=1 Tax=Streptomyces sp. NPDC014986 TaxID=3364934 RepID=UPI0037016194